jgi:hypothetical protein
MVTSTPRSNRVKYCEKCGRLIQSGEEFRSYDKVSASAAGLTVYLHVVCPPKTGLSAR